MNILYRAINKKGINLKSDYDRFLFYQDHFYDNIYYVDEMGCYNGYTNYTLESTDGFVLKNDFLSEDSSVKDVLYWFDTNPGKYRVAVTRGGILVGEYYDSDSDGKCLYQNVEEKALDIAECFKTDIREWAMGKTVSIVGNDRNKVDMLRRIIYNEKPDAVSEYDCIIDMNLCPDFRKRMMVRQDNVLSVSEVIVPILIRKLISYLHKNNINFYVFDGIRKSEINDLSSKERQNVSKSIEEILQDDVYLSSFVDKDKESRLLLSKHTKDLNQIARFMSNGIHNILVDRNEDCLNVMDGVRYTVDNPTNPEHIIHMYGPCVVYGLCVADSKTIASILQRKVNDSGLYNIQVVNHGLSYGKDLLNDILYMMSTPIAPGDTVVWFSGFMEDEISLFKSMNVEICCLKDCIKKLHNWFLDNPFHCNSVANTIYAVKMYEVIKFKLDQQFQSKNKISMIENCDIPLVFDPDAILQSPHLNEYIKFLNGFKVDDSSKVKGCIVLNANPCTKGHLHLITEALKRVDLLYLFLVQESSLGYSYLDRENMLKMNLKGKRNVIVLPGGNIFTSSIGFPEYFNRTSQKVNPLRNHKIFCERIAPALDISIRFFGQEPYDNVTHLLNVTAKEYLPKHGVEVKILPRLELEGIPISAKDVRRFMKNKDYKRVLSLVSHCTFEYLLKIG